MSEEEKQKGGKVTADSITNKIKAEMRKSKQKGLEAKVKALQSEIDSAQDIVNMKEKELVELFEDHEDLLD